MTPEQITALVASLLGGEPDGTNFETVMAAMENLAYEMAVECRRSAGHRTGPPVTDLE